MMDFKHESVLLKETVDMLSIREDGIYADGTLGGGGHGSAICERLNREGILIGIDRDRDALSAAEKRLSGFSCQKTYIQSEYRRIKEILGDLYIAKINGAILDLGVSSFQLDNPDRGFSYMQDAPLDMRMNRDDGFTAEDVVMGYGEGDLTRILRDYGEERWAARISKFIVREREKAPIKTTGRLVEIIKAAIPAKARREGPHPAKRTFQAIRIEVNGELSQLEQAVDDFIDVLDSGGRLCIITFHSLEDRIVKERFKKRLDPCTCPKELPCACGKKTDVRKVSGKPILPGDSELERNPRARSAKLRVIEKL